MLVQLHKNMIINTNDIQRLELQIDEEEKEDSPDRELCFLRLRDDHRGYVVSGSFFHKVQAIIKGNLFKPTHKHVKRGTNYQVIGDVVMQCEVPDFDNKRLVLYRDEDGKYWCRAPREFNDGRFEEIE